MKPAIDTRGIAAHLDSMSERWFGLPRSQAIREEFCLLCRQHVLVEMLPPREKENFARSGLCPGCRDDLIRRAKG